MLKKVFCTMLVVILTTSVLYGCDTSSSEESSSAQSSSEASSSAVSTLPESSIISDDKIPAPAIDPAEVSSQTAPVSGASVFTVNTELREKYYDILSRFYSQTLPLTDFETPEQLNANELVNYAVGVTDFLQHSQTSVASMYLFDFLELQSSLQKYLGVQINYTSNISGFIYNSGNNILYADFVLPSYSHYYRLESLSVDENGLYTAVFNVYRDIFTTEDAYNNSLADVKAAVTKNTVTTELTNSAEITLTFYEMLDADGTTYLLLQSKSTVRK